MYARYLHCSTTFCRFALVALSIDPAQRVPESRSLTSEICRDAIFQRSLRFAEICIDISHNNCRDLARFAEMRGAAFVGERGGAPERARHSTMCFPSNASAQWRPDGLTFHTKKWFLGARFLGALLISSEVSKMAEQRADSTVMWAE